MSQTELSFFDNAVFKVNKKLRTKVYVKLTDRQSYLHSKSEHPDSTKKSIAYSQAVSSIKFPTIEAIFITTVNDYLTG